MFENDDGPVEGSPTEVLVPGLSKWDLIGKQRSQVILAKLCPALSTEVAEKWSKMECVEALSLACNVDPRSVVPSKLFGDIITSAVARYEENLRPFHGISLKRVEAGSAKNKYTKQVLDYEKVGVFTFDAQAKTITHRREKQSAGLPVHMINDAKFALLHNWHEAKAIIRASWNDTLVLRFFEAANVVIDNRPLLLATKDEARRNESLAKAASPKRLVRRRTSEGASPARRVEPAAPSAIRTDEASGRLMRLLPERCFPRRAACCGPGTCT